MELAVKLRLDQQLGGWLAALTPCYRQIRSQRRFDATQRHLLGNLEMGAPADSVVERVILDLPGQRVESVCESDIARARLVVAESDTGQTRHGHLAHCWTGQ